MTMENQPFEDVSSIKNGDVPASHITFVGGNAFWATFFLQLFSIKKCQFQNDALKKVTPFKIWPCFHVWYLCYNFAAAFSRFFNEKNQSVRQMIL